MASGPGAGGPRPSSASPSWGRRARHSQRYPDRIWAFRGEAEGDARDCFTNSRCVGEGMLAPPRKLLHPGLETSSEWQNGAWALRSPEASRRHGRSTETARTAHVCMTVAVCQQNRRTQTVRPTQLSRDNVPDGASHPVLFQGDPRHERLEGSVPSLPPSSVPTAQTAHGRSLGCPRPDLQLDVTNPCPSVRGLQMSPGVSHSGKVT